VPWSISLFPLLVLFFFVFFWWGAFFLFRFLRERDQETVYHRRGTGGKELVARASNARSGAERNAVDQGQTARLSEKRCSSPALFGKSAAITGAGDDQDGQVRDADGGTIFLEE